MAFKSTQTDYFGIAGSTITCTSSDENKQITVVQAHNEKGDFVTQDTCGEYEQPNCSYVLTADSSLATVKIGSPVSAGSKKYTVTSINIETGAGSPPSISASGEEVPTTSHNDCYYDIPSATIKVCHHAQILWGCVTNTTFGTGNYLTQASYSATANITKATKDGETLAYDVSEGVITATLTIQKTGSATPTITKGSDWEITSPLTASNPDADYPTYTVTLTKLLAHHTGTGS